MESIQQRLQTLIYQHGTQSLNAEEWKELWQLLEGMDASEIEDDALMTLWEDSRRYPLSDQSDLYEKRVKPRLVETTDEEVLSVIGNRRRYWWVAAALVVVGLSAGGYIWYKKKSAIELTQQADQPLKDDLEPGDNKAILTLVDGSKIILDSARNGWLTNQGNTTVKVEEGQIAYNATQEEEKQVGYNMVTTPYGGQYVVVLPDNSHVWLNAGSSLRFPTAFTGKERTVTLTGEGYFEITRDANRPFHVSAGETDIAVLGTHFNVNAYPDEGMLRATLLEGSIKVHNGRNDVLLRQGQQARIKGGIMVATVDTVPVVAWKNGLFNFNEVDIAEIMRQVARWYDVEVVFEAPVSDRFVAKIPRDVPVSRLLGLLQSTNEVHFTVEGKRITVRP